MRKHILINSMEIINRSKMNQVPGGKDYIGYKLNPTNDVREISMRARNVVPHDADRRQSL